MKNLRIQRFLHIAATLLTIQRLRERHQRSQFYLFEALGKNSLAARMAGVSEQDIENLKSAAEQAWIEEGIDVCCEAIDLDSDQIKSFGFSEDWRRLA
jgi:hypothetical protein